MTKYEVDDSFNLFTETWIVTQVATFSGVPHYGCVIYTDGRDCFMGNVTYGFIPCFVADEYAEPTQK